CPTCNGLGFQMIFDPDLIIPDKSLSISEGAVATYKNYFDGFRVQYLKGVGDYLGFTLMTPIEELTGEQYNGLMYGTGDAQIHFKQSSRNAEFAYHGTWEGLLPQVARLHSESKSDYRKAELEKFMRILPCPTCHGKRLKESVLAVKIAGKSIADVTDMSIDEAISFFDSLTLTEKEGEIARLILREIHSRLTFLQEVGLGYLTLSRSAGSLSGGEAQRIRLATQIGSNLMGVLYILDEPSIGLHQRDNQKLIATLKHLRDLGNTVIVVEHDEETIRAADYVIDIGPGAGIYGGKITAAGTPQEIAEAKDSLTGKYLSGEYEIPVPASRRTSDSYLTISGCTENNLKNVTAKIPLGTLTVVTGVSGSGKSTLIYDTLYQALRQKLHQSKETPGAFKSLSFDGKLENVIVIDQSPIGRTPRSNPATYTKVFDDIRKIFAETTEAKIRGYGPGRFSFNVKGGRCEACSGDGVMKIEMNFLPDVYVECEECKGTRYNAETLEVKFKGKSISDVLNMSVDEALELFSAHPNVTAKLQTLADVGLGYIKLGQSSTTLSGGEAQRIKLTRELAKRSGGKTVYILDEPTTGLHFHDVKKLIGVLDSLVEKGNTVIVIEHNLDVIKSADYILDLGPEGGSAGGQIIAKGTPEEVARVKKSYTGQFLKQMLK
ncbi:MAG: excinuclease ABC subunit UvrA, partial [Methanocorpusculum sp.]|nr:excinuclease ABC subunit UvrA [Methanocorpusculum sp.]